MLFGLGTFITAFLTLLTPLAANSGVTAFITVRVLEGLGEVCRPIPKTEQKSCVKCCIYTMSQFQGFHFLFVIYLGSHLPCHDFYDFKMAST